MSKPITAFIPFNDREFTRSTIEQLNATSLVDSIEVLAMAGSDTRLEGAHMSSVESLLSASTIQLIASRASAPYTLLLTQDTSLEFAPHGLQRFFQVADATGAAMVYSDYSEVRKGVRSPHPTNDYQLGSLKDDFTFGPVLFISTAALRSAAAQIAGAKHQYAGMYALRLALSRTGPIVRIPEYLYSKIETDVRTSGEKQFDYVDPRNRAAQVELEQACTDHLKWIDAYLPPQFKQIDSSDGTFDVEASVIIPVKNRARTINDAVGSVLKQKTSFPFNLIVVDNHSTDGTTDILKQVAAQDPRLIHVIPTRHDLGIGGCWTEAVHHKSCGRFAVQLDSDDMYKDETTIQRVVNTFRAEKCAMVIGSYQMTNFQLQEIPPGVIDHREWTPDNGRNNALRINGLGAPRAFYTPLLRQINVPNVSYGEDYAVGLAISRDYQIGRIYDPIYMCRRWEGNTDANLDVERLNTYNAYKDKLRTIEVLARQKRNRDAGKSQS